MTADDDLRQTVREFKESVSADLDGMHHRIDDLSDEIRQRVTTAETTIVNELRAMTGRIEQHLVRVDNRLSDIEKRLP